ncbi:Oxalyl-CoA decarboxylase [Lactobacillus helveticus]|nr:Oxalyl-CoA decarboxylase [Lactobacillus helveticus]NRO32163.1 Oxalyl-CoA decarboxylase [Lactobacillus helveticus]NRO40313.1 Oxalyl-CoA decarboxylase [Lactobacillus helveticus]NRO55702.1 Oxalyl-CoA decarboxylase [Lactobacillus helveticus]NRO71606.1 Oxalyl-CoA decarboxylase [Lactobacillus helveticus]
MLNSTKLKLTQLNLIQTERLMHYYKVISSLYCKNWFQLSKRLALRAPQDWLDLIAQDSKKNNDKFAARISASEAKPTLGYYSAIEPINDLMPKHPDTYIISEGANTLDIGRNLVGMQKPRHRLDTGTWGVMGVGLGYAIATAVETGKPVIALEGHLVSMVWKWKPFVVTTYLLLLSLLTTVVFTMVMLT